MRENTIRVGCAGWSIPKEHAVTFPTEGTHLTRYAGRFPAVEINSSFYRPHRPATYTRWAGCVPDDFRFAAKVPREATHARRLVGTEAILDRFLEEVTALGPRLGPLLVQLPPSLPFDASVAGRFFTAVRDRFDGAVVLEPRHASWFASEAEQLAAAFRASRVAADPAVVAGASEPGGWVGLVYFRLHGSPKVYYSAYDEPYLNGLADKLVGAAKAAAVWCIFDNTAEGAATANALDLLRRIRAGHPADAAATGTATRRSRA